MSHFDPGLFKEARAEPFRSVRSKRPAVFALGLFAAYAVWAVVLLIFHEPWRDEAQQWLVARDLDLLPMLAHLKNEGHPALWYLILWPIAHSGAGYGALKVLQAALVLAVGALIAFRSPFRPALKAAFLFAVPLGYQYLAVARSYTLMTLLLLLTAAVYPHRRRRWPLYGLLLLLLCNTHVMGILSVFCILLYDALTLKNDPRSARRQERKRTLLSFVFACLFAAAGILLVDLTLRGSRQVAVSFASPAALLRADYASVGWSLFRTGFFGGFAHQIGILLASSLSGTAPALSFLFLFILPFCALALVLRRAETAFFTALYTFLLAVLSVYKNGLADYQAEMIAVMFLFGLWLAQEERAERPSLCKNWEAFAAALRIGRVNAFKVLGIIALAASVLSSAAIAVNDIRYPYSQAESAAEVLIRNGYDRSGTVLLGSRIGRCNAILPYLTHVRYFTLGRAPWRISYSLGTQAQHRYRMTDAALFALARREKADGRTPVIVLTAAAPSVPSDFTLLYDGGGRNTLVGKEEYRLYVLKKSVG